MPVLAQAHQSTSRELKSFKKQAVSELIWPFQKRAKHDTHAGLVLDPQQGGSVAVVQRQGAGLRLRHCARCDAPEDGNWQSVVDALMGDFQGPVNLVAPAGSYQLLLVERPDVPDTELAAAVRWRIRELLNSPVEKSIVDVFDIPAQARGSRNMTYAVAMHTDTGSQLANHLHDCGAQLAAIDIPELCQRNIATHLEQDRFGVAFLSVHGRHGVLTITRDKKLYVIRQMEIPFAGVGEGLENNAVSSVALELQRSLDYFESHYDQRPIRDVVLAPSPDGVSLCAALTRELTVNVSLLDLNTLLETTEQMNSDAQADCLLAIGAALRGPDVLISKDMAA